MKKNSISKLINYSKILVLACVTFFSMIITKPSFSQEPYYFHTIHSHGLSFIGGRTAKVNYLYQLARNRQLKLSGTYIYDSYNQGKNKIKSNIYVTNIQFQYNLLNTERFFLNCGFGLGGYYLTAKDLLDIKHKEWRIDFTAGLQLEFYIVRNTIALTVDYDLIYMPWSKIYEFMHVPTGGITFYFF